MAAGPHQFLGGMETPCSVATPCVPNAGRPWGGVKEAADQPLQGYGQSWDAKGGGLLPRGSGSISGMLVYVHFKKKIKNKAVQLVSNNIREIKQFSEL